MTEKRLATELKRLGDSNWVTFCNPARSQFGDDGLNGHFWVERNGKVVDTYWDSYNDCRRTMRIKNKTLLYFECTNKLTTAIMMSKVKKSITILTGDYDTSLEYLCHRLRKPMEDCCMFNAFVEAHLNGGEIKFGSLGINTDDGGLTCWLSGNSKFTTFADYTAPETHDRVSPAQTPTATLT